ncbi:DUF3718 domain-containing protein [Alteromonas sp. KUL49]|uniref:DUF3718 domain-containing protein n=1 Tax=Alteromonas sp. KUL49 TaxID=2480798 RepID=UPI00102EDCFD|nr:DUF3718 domain-containing protein [Alteromonas sp. KUL49]TAP37930.1 DUF3718 domain-containing protein [Alteromonas sp. KUL49]GEA12792.1 hypothetical protein KUL49_31670 [Alteromonas sp. KUL49]
MKTFTKTLAVVGMTFGIAGVASANVEFVPSDDTASTNICVSAAEGNKNNLRDAIENAGVSKRYVATKMTCNDMPVIEFVAQYSENPDAINSYITNGKYNSSSFIASVNAAN